MCQICTVVHLICFLGKRRVVHLNPHLRIASAVIMPHCLTQSFDINNTVIPPCPNFVGVTLSVLICCHLAMNRHYLAFFCGVYVFLGPPSILFKFWLCHSF